jgi:hypothetical protein
VLTLRDHHNAVTAAAVGGKPSSDVVQFHMINLCVVQPIIACNRTVSIILDYYLAP